MLAELRPLLVLAGPLALTNMGQHFMAVVDTAMLGRYGEEAMAGAGIAGGAYFAITVIGLGVMLGLDALVPQALGAGDPRRAHTYYRAGLRLALRLSVPLAVLILAIAWAFPRGGLAPGVAAAAQEFMLLRLPGILPFLLMVAQRSYLQAHGKTFPIVLTMILGNLANAIGNVVLVFGDDGLARLGLPPLGLPPLGAAGSALSSTLVSVLGYGYLQLAIRRLGAVSPAPHGEDLRLLLRIGLPVGLQLLAEVGVFALAAYLVGNLQGHAAAAHQVAISLASLSFASAIGIGAAGAVRVGRAIGGGDRPAARRAATASFVLGMLAMGSAGLAFALAPAALASIFTDDVAVIAAAAPLIQIAAVFQLSDSLQAVGAGVLRGAGDTRAAFVANVVGHYAVGLPVALILAFPLGYGAPGIWWGLTSGLSAVALFLVVRFYRLIARPVAAIAPPPAPPASSDPA
jgi:MATE family multidrug resistance protein